MREGVDKGTMGEKMGGRRRGQEGGRQGRG